MLIVLHLDEEQTAGSRENCGPTVWKTTEGRSEKNCSKRSAYHNCWDPAAFRVTDYWCHRPLIGVGACSLGAHSLWSQTLYLGNHSLDWVLTVYKHNFLILCSTHWTGGLQSANSGSQGSLIGLCAYSLWAELADIRNHHWTGTYSLAACHVRAY